VKDLVVPLTQSDPADARRLTLEANAARNVLDAPHQSVVNAPRGDDPVDLPHDVDPTGEQTESAEQRAGSSLSDEGSTEIINDSGREVLLQMEKVTSEPAWSGLKYLVSSRFPLAEPLVDALAEACDEHLQDTLREKVPELVKQFMERTGDIKASISTAAKTVTPTVNVPKLARTYATAASNLVAAQQNSLKYLSGLDRRLERRKRARPGHHYRLPGGPKRPAVRRRHPAGAHLVGSRAANRCGGRSPGEGECSRGFGGRRNRPAQRCRCHPHARHGGFVTDQAARHSHRPAALRLPVRLSHRHRVSGGRCAT
jgi:hypothetical protein